MRRFTLRALACAVLLVSAAAAAAPWVEPGDALLRHHIQVLADAGVIKGPVTSWPMSWGGIARDMAAANADALDPMAQDSYYAVQTVIDEQSDLGPSLLGAAHLGTSDTAITSFDSRRREQGELTSGVQWLGQRWAGRAQVTAVLDPIDDREYRADGSYLAGQLGNWMFAAGMVDRWWGPGWQSSLILSSNARPLPALSFQRIAPEAPDWRWLSWLGPWQLSGFFGRMEDGEQSVPHHYLLGARLVLKPFGFLELGASRTAQWGGDGRPTSFDSLVDLLIGNDNQAQQQDQPGNQLAGFDGRLSFPFGGARHALYAQAIGEDEANYRPSKYIRLGGLESSFALGRWQHRLVLEAADTKADTSVKADPATPPGYNIAYENDIYRTGYRRYGRPIGASFDNDSRVISLSGQHLPSRFHRIAWTVADIEINRDGTNEPPPGGSVYGGAQDTRYARLSYAFPLSGGWDVELGGEYYADDLPLGGEDIGSNVFLSLSTTVD